MSKLPETIHGYVDNVTIVDNHFSPPIHRAIESVARGGKRNPTLLLKLTSLRLVQLGIPSDEAVKVLYRSVQKLKPRDEILYQLIDSHILTERVDFYTSLPEHVHSIATGETSFDPTILFHHLVADILYVGGYSSQKTVSVLTNGTRNLIKWRKSFASKR